MIQEDLMGEGIEYKLSGSARVLVLMGERLKATFE
jgi:hypothetical protein